MASTVTPTQTRYNDPYQQTIFDFNTPDSKVYISRESNKLLNAIGNNFVLKGMEMSTPQVASDVGMVGSIAAAPTAGGTGYTVGDTLTIVTGGTNATCSVDTISGGGATGPVTAVTLLSSGTGGYSVGTGKVTTGGTGNGCTVNITALLPCVVRTTISAGIAIQDETIIKTTTVGTIDIDCSALDDTDVGGAHIGVFLKYQYLASVEASLASIAIFHISSAGVVTDPSAAFSLDTCKTMLGVINFTKTGSLVTGVSSYDLPTLVVAGTTMYKRGYSSSNINLPGLFESNFASYREYLLRMDYLLAE